jgi:hypothetical protein
VANKLTAAAILPFRGIRGKLNLRVNHLLPFALPAFPSPRTVPPCYVAKGLEPKPGWPNRAHLLRCYVSSATASVDVTETRNSPALAANGFADEARYAAGLPPTPVIWQANARGAGGKSAACLPRWFRSSPKFWHPLRVSNEASFPSWLVMRSHCLTRARV